MVPVPILLAALALANCSGVAKPAAPFKLLINGEPGTISAKTASNYDVVLCIEVSRAHKPPNVFYAPLGHFHPPRPPQNTSALSSRPVDMLYQSSNCDPRREQFAETVRRVFEAKKLRFEYSGKCNAGSRRRRFKMPGNSAELSTKFMISMSRGQSPESEALDEKLALPIIHGAALPLYVGTGSRLATELGYPMHVIVNRANFPSDGKAAEAAAKLARDPAQLDRRQRRLLGFEETIGSHGGQAYVGCRNFSFLTKQVQVRVSNNRRHPVFLEHLNFLFGGRYQFLWGARADVIIDQCCW